MNWRVVSLLVLVALELGPICGQGRRRQRQQQNVSSSQCYRGLFLSEEELGALKTASVPKFRQLYRMTNFTKEVTHGESCGYQVDGRSRTSSLVDCRANSNTNLIAKRSSGTCQPCCQTTMAFVVPNTVAEVVSGNEYQAKHFPTSYQLLHTGHCVNEGAACGFQGTCDQAMRIEWVLVELPTGDKFVPTYIPSHCTCIYS